MKARARLALGPRQVAARVRDRQDVHGRGAEAHRHEVLAGVFGHRGGGGAAVGGGGCAVVEGGFAGGGAVEGGAEKVEGGFGRVITGRAGGAAADEIHGDDLRGRGDGEEKERKCGGGVVKSHRF
ncbi:hypothetical protein STAS_03953 [Striga asiatica]|uniref:Uncharacterized protein n=1 Tax=Striga asiatica TaxID=4170 RepID=A0A5A7P6R4_STRAF|nr:hypothetical protein STAS_03953 [Striga asiatica]